MSGYFVLFEECTAEVGISYIASCLFDAHPWNEKNGLAPTQVARYVLITSLAVFLMVFPLRLKTWGLFLGHKAQDKHQAMR